MASYFYEDAPAFTQVVIGKTYAFVLNAFGEVGDPKSDKGKNASSGSKQSTSKEKRMCGARQPQGQSFKGAWTQRHHKAKR